ncbi:unnamed protein product [Blepharisma stoltei]|uniref:Uncharacterized protein n=1 Tax=Blepharisma stoltei TaxID=1481888 RepID=A0AAU9JP75_9CILI|nr:unnamed protein product [Blepharisma stoltei]
MAHRRVPLTQLVAAVDNNLPASSIIRDPSGNAYTFYKYKGTLAERASNEWNPATLARKAKYAVTKGDTLAIVMNPNDDITDMIQPNIIPANFFNRNRLRDEDLEPFMEDRRDYLFVHEKFRLVVILTEDGAPHCLQRYIDAGDFQFIDIE